MAGREALPEDQQDGATPFAPRTTKDRIEEELFARKSDLFSDLALVFFDTTAIYFHGEGGQTIGQRGHSKDHRPDRNQMVDFVEQVGEAEAGGRLFSSPLG